MLKRDVFVNLPGVAQRARLGEAEADALRRLAELERVNASEAARLAIREACRARGLWPPKVEAHNER